MDFNPEPYNIPEALLHWATIFGTLSTIVAAVVLLTSLAAGGTSGPRRLFAALLQTPGQKVGAALGALIGGPLVGYLGWMHGGDALARLAAFLGASSPISPTIGQIIGAVVGGLAGLAAGAMLGAALLDSLKAAPRRVAALGSLTLKESIRRKALLVFVIFAILFMFAGWFLSLSNSRAEMQVKVYVSFVLTAISWLIIPVVLLLSCWGLPEDIRLRSLHTVVTKPVRRNEVVMGRILGFLGVGTLVLLVMGLAGYIWIQRQIPSEAKSQLVSRVPIYGTLSFLDREGNPAQAGVNVGDIWDFRSYIEGATKARAIYEFRGVTPAALVPVQGPDDEKPVRRLRLESKFEAFRTYKGEIEESIRYQYVFVNPQKNLEVPHQVLAIKEFGENVTYIDPKITYYDETAKELKTVDLFEDLAPDGTLRVDIRCVDAMQYLGMSKADLFVRTPDRAFVAGYSKALLSIWLMMALVITVGVTASCFVKGPVATLLTFTLFVVGLSFHGFLAELITPGEAQGMGMTESIYRIAEHMNPQTPLGEGTTFTVMQKTDEAITGGLWLVYNVVPNFNNFNGSKYVANGFDVPWNASLLPAVATTLAYLLPCLLLGFYSLKLRELEAK